MEKKNKKNGKLKYKCEFQKKTQKRERIPQ